MNRIQLPRLIKDPIKSLLRSLDVGITRYGTLEKLRFLERDHSDIEFLRAIYHTGITPSTLAGLHKALEYLPKSTSQYRQDIFVLSQLNFKTHGYFVEFGATDGVNLSNTYLLETEFDWTGILAEPARRWQHDLRRNRGAHIDTRCVWRDSHSTLTFTEAEHTGLSTISAFSDTDLHRDARKRRSNTYNVDTISLIDLLEKYNAPRVIDYLSIDTEGSEFEILRSFDFSRYKFRIITCEHNYSPIREKIFQLLKKNGYSRILQEISFVDDWYISD